MEYFAKTKRMVCRALVTITTVTLTRVNVVRRFRVVRTYGQINVIVGEGVNHRVMICKRENVLCNIMKLCE